MRHRRRVLVGAVGVALLAVGVWVVVPAGRTAPSSGTSWTTGQEVLARTTFHAGRVTITGVRDFDWTGDGPPVARWTTGHYDLASLRSAWFVLTPFDAGGWRGPAHTFLSFGFADGRYLSVSVEARLEEGETYSLVSGMLRRFEVMYVIGEERDLIGLRAVRRNDAVYLYPVRAEPAALQRLFVDMLERANRVAERPETYHTLWNNCTTAILHHINPLLPRPIPYGPRILLPGYADALALDRGLLATDLPIEEARSRFLVSARARQAAGDPAFSARIREGMSGP